jgi:uncharacterized caspase-like protein
MFKLTSLSRHFQQRLASGVLAMALMVSLMPTAAQAPIDLRVALVIGNAAYPGVAALANPGNDAKAMGDALRGLGFSVVEARDASRAQMNEAIAKVRDQLKGKNGIGMLYYAGHGLQVDWRNYMVPVDAKMNNASDVPNQTVELGSVIDAFKQAGNRMNIVVLDACRDNPFQGTATAKGLAQLDAPPGTFLAFATAPGNVAEDGDAKAESNGLYTRYLLQELKKPQAKIEDVFKRVRLNVRQQSQGRQIPWESTSLEDDFFFDKGLEAAKRGQGESDAAYRMQLTIWNSIKGTERADELIEYLKTFPSGYFSELAQFRLDQLTRPTVLAVSKPSDPLANNSQTRRAYVGSVKEMQTVSQEFFTGGRYAKFINKEEVVKVDDQHIYSKYAFDGWGKPTQTQMILDLMGNPISGPDFKRDTPLQMAPAEYRVGYKWKYTDRGTTTESGTVTSEYEARILARETVETKIGPIEAFKIEHKRWRSDGLTEERISWAVPGEMASIKSTRKLYNGGRLVYSQTNDLVSFKSGAPKQ